MCSFEIFVLALLVDVIEEFHWLKALEVKSWAFAFIT